MRPGILVLLLTTSAAAQTQLPVTRVSLYKNGVGFFEHSGRVTGSQSVTIDFTTAQLNDVLQTLTAIDLQGGRITGAGYNSTTPLEQQLKALPLALGQDATSTDFYNAIRGARVEVRSGPTPITGRLLSIELRTTTATDKLPETERRFLTVVSESGSVRTVELTSTTEVRLLDTALHTDVTRYLELLASTRNAGLRHLTLQDIGTGARDLRVSYLSEVPVWKSTYRILIDDTPARHSVSCDPAVQGPSHWNPDGTGSFSGSQTCHQMDSIPLPATTATLQGWSVVDNTTGADWTNVQLSLIAGAPQSFIQPLSTPYYTRRPEIPLPSEAQIAPQTHESGLEKNENLDALSTDNHAIAPTLSAKMARGIALRNGSGSGLGGGVGVAGFTEGSAGGVLGGISGAPAPIAYERSAEASIIPHTLTNAFDDFFQYTLTDPITIRKNESALVPILQTKVSAERVTLWSPSSQTPLRALWITNTSNLTLDRGSFSIVENGNFGGEGLLDPIHPNEKRLLSYAADQAVRVTNDNSHYTSRVEHVTIAKGVLTQTSTDIAEIEYAIHNAAPEPRLVVVEQPIRQGWTLDSDPKPAETTPTVYRFRVATQPGESVHLHIGEHRVNKQTIRLVDRSVEQITLLLQNAKVSPAALTQLQPVFDSHAAVVAFDEQIRAKEAEITSITADQDRLRENMKALKGSSEERALITRYTNELNAQEDRLATLHKEIDALHTQRTAEDQHFQILLAAVNFDQTL